MKKAALDLTIKAMFAIFIVLFVLFVGFSVLGTRTETLQQTAQFSQQRTEESFFLNLLGSRCLSVADFRNKSVYVETQGFISQKKIDKLHLGNEDLRCAENYDFFYSIKITDEVNGKEWQVSILPNDAYGNSRTTSLPATILYDNTTIPTTNIARAFFTSYVGPFPKLYGALKKACRTMNSDSLSLNLRRDVSYDNESNTIYYGKEEFYPYFGCGVLGFNITRGSHLLYLSYSGGKVTVT